jgi:predicted DsbA family dithiol-disulfide isomerase
MNLSPADFALAKQFAGSLEPKAARRSVDELTEAELQAIDRDFEARKAADPFRAREAYDAAHAQNHRLQQQGRL